MRFRLNFQGFLQSCPVFLVIFAAAAPADAQSPPALSGIVRDGSAAVITGATVIVEAPGSSVSRTVESGRDGRFEVRTLPRGEYRLTIVAPGFEPAERAVYVPASEPTNITLHPAPVIEQV